MSCRTDITEPIEFLPDGIDETVFQIKHVNEGVSKSARSPLVYESGALTLQFTAQQRQLPLVEA